MSTKIFCFLLGVLAALAVETTAQTTEVPNLDPQGPSTYFDNQGHLIYRQPSLIPGGGAIQWGHPHGPILEVPSLNHQGSSSYFNSQGNLCIRQPSLNPLGGAYHWCGSGGSTLKPTSSGMSGAALLGYWLGSWLRELWASKPEEPLTVPHKGVEASKVAAPQEPKGFSESAVVEEQRIFPPIPGMLKLGIANVTTRKDVHEIEFHGTQDEVLRSFIVQARQRGFSSGEIYEHLRAQGINPPESLQKEALAEFMNKYLVSDDREKDPKLELQQLAERFPAANPQTVREFGEQIFLGAYIRAKQRLRATGKLVTERALAQAAFDEAISTVGPAYVSEVARRDLDRSRFDSEDALMVDLLSKWLEGNERAGQLYGVWLEKRLGRITDEEFFKRAASIQAEQKTEVGSQPTKFGTTQEQLARDGVTTITERSPVGTFDTDSLQAYADYIDRLRTTLHGNPNFQNFQAMSQDPMMRPRMLQVTRNALISNVPGFHQLSDADQMQLAERALMGTLQPTTGK